MEHARMSKGNSGLVVGVTRGEHGGEAGDFFLATTHGAGLLVLPAAANDLERAFAVNFFLQSPQRTVHRFAFFQFNLCQCTHFLSGGGKSLPLGSARRIKNDERWWRDPELNRGHKDFQSSALPTELSRRRQRICLQTVNGDFVSEDFQSAAMRSLREIYYAGCTANASLFMANPDRAIASTGKTDCLSVA